MQATVVTVEPGEIRLQINLTPGVGLSPENRHLPAASVYLFNAAKPQSGAVQITRQQRNPNQSSCEIAFIYQPPADISKVPAISVAFAALFVAVFAIRQRLKKGSK